MRMRLACWTMIAGHLFASTAIADTFTVTSTAVDAPSDAAASGSLGWAVYQANTNPGADTIEFDIPGDGSPVTIQGAAEYKLTDAATTIDGFSQSGAASGSTLPPLAPDPVLKVAVSGEAMTRRARASLLKRRRDRLSTKVFL